MSHVLRQKKKDAKDTSLLPVQNKSQYKNIMYLGLPAVERSAIRWRRVGALMSRMADFPHKTITINMLPTIAISAD